MTKVMIIGATGSIARVVAPELLKNTDADLVLASRRGSKRVVTDASRETAISLDVNDEAATAKALAGVDFVFASLSGSMDTMAKHLIAAMDQAGVKRLAFITTMGIYQEIPAWLGESPEPYSNLILGTYRRAADAIEASDLDYTILRPGWLDNGPANYELTKKGEPFGGHDVSRYAIADVITKITNDPQFGSHEIFGINRPQAH